VYADPPVALPSAGRAASGREYQRLRGQRRREAGDAWRRAEAAVREVHEALADAADGARLHPPQDPRLSGEPGQNLLNGAYLVRRDDEPAFTALAGRLAGTTTGLRLRLSGPWVPYSFTAAAAGGTEAEPEAEEARW
jgi:hypothetical protein